MRVGSPTLQTMVKMVAAVIVSPDIGKYSIRISIMTFIAMVKAVRAVKKRSVKTKKSLYAIGTT